jgi:hypothetical protein
MEEPHQPHIDVSATSDALDARPAAKARERASYAETRKPGSPLPVAKTKAPDFGRSGSLRIRWGAIYPAQREHNGSFRSAIWTLQGSFHSTSCETPVSPLLSQSSPAGVGGGEAEEWKTEAEGGESKINLPRFKSRLDLPAGISVIASGIAHGAPGLSASILLS